MSHALDGLQGTLHFRWDCNYALLNTGLGSTGWVLSAARELCSSADGDSGSESKTSAFDLYVSQPYQGRESSVLKIPSQRLVRYGSVEIQSLMNEGGICATGEQVIQLNRGDKIHARLVDGVPDILAFGIYTSELDCRMTGLISADSNESNGWLYVGNESKLFMSRYIVRLYEEKDGAPVLAVEEEQKSSGIFLAAHGYASQWSKQTC